MVPRTNGVHPQDKARVLEKDERWVTFLEIFIILLTKWKELVSRGLCSLTVSKLLQGTGQSQRRDGELSRLGGQCPDVTKTVKFHFIRGIASVTRATRKAELRVR